MIADRGDTWDLSPNDKSALQSLLLMCEVGQLLRDACEVNADRLPHGVADACDDFDATKAGAE